MTKNTKKRKKESDNKTEARIDAYKEDTFINQVTGINVSGRDKRMAATPLAPTVLDQTALANMFDGDSLSRKMVVKPVQAELRNWVDFQELDQDTDDAMSKYINDHEFKAAIREARIWEDVFGGSILYLGLNDGGPPDKPVNVNNIKTIDFAIPLDRFKATIRYDALGRPEYFDVNSAIHSLNIHESRVLWFPGPLSTPHTREKRGGWGASVFEPAYERLSDVAGAFSSTAVIVQTFVQTVLRINGLVDAIINGNESYLSDRVSGIDYARSVVHAIILDEGEQYETITANVAGLPDLIDREMMLAAEAMDIPVELIFGPIHGGLGDSSNTSMQQWHERIGDQQEERLRPRLQKLFTYILLAKDGPTGGVVPPDWSFKFRPLDRPDDKKQAETHLIQAQADAINTVNGYVTAMEVRESRFGSEEYSTHTTLDAGGETVLADLEAAKQELANALSRQSPDPDPDGDEDEGEDVQ